MSIQAGFNLRGRNPDVLTCIANLSNDEVFRPAEIANRMLNTLASPTPLHNPQSTIRNRMIDPQTVHVA